MPRLRGHHLICLHFFHGTGYDEDFVVNLMRVTESLRHEKIEIVHGPDDVCRKCRHLERERCGYSEDADGEMERMDSLALRLLTASRGERIEWDVIRKRLPGLFSGWYESCCTGCDWRRACEQDALYRELRMGP
ncbi:MAG TPA: DUF1284 domain-containing protein [Thermodesulfovibrionales bacterium]|nr:DUF1284 domain-containing protein [Thermodesulfovibrionales bacterium]